MFSLFGQSTVNLLLIDADEVMHLRWQNGELNQIDLYHSTDSDFDRFHVFLENDGKTPFAIVTDVIEEDFRTESVAHVTGADRKALIARKLAHLFRTTRYRTARVIGREKEGRRDDRILFTALTKPDIFEPWLTRLLAQKIPVISVTSAAYVIEHFAQTLSLTSAPHLLIVNQEANSGLRQTYLQKGRVIFGRLTPSGVSRSGSFAELLLEQCDQTRKYLERIKQLPYDTPLQVYVFTPEVVTDERETTKDLLHFHYRSIEELPLTRKINITNAHPGAIAYSLISGLRKRAIPNVYAPEHALRYLKIRKMSSALYSMSALVVLVAGIIVGPTLADAGSKWDQERQLRERTAPLLVEYERLTERFPETPIPSAQMEIVVETYDRIARQVARPVEIMSLIGQGLAASPDLKLSEVFWSLDVITSTDTDTGFGTAPVVSESQRVQQALVEGRSQLVVTVRGLVQSEASFRDATAQVIAFVDALKINKGYEITPLSLPINVSSNINVATTVDGSAARGEFAIEIRRKFLQ
tara:strand:+ start:26709 stop:28286 length:1578 start_codon:yes stop_codon:yes gene_type:complete